MEPVPHTKSQKQITHCKNVEKGQEKGSAN